MAKAKKNLLQLTEEMEMSPIITVDTSTQLITITPQKENLHKTKNLKSHPNIATYHINEGLIEDEIVTSKLTSDIEKEMKHNQTELMNKKIKLKFNKGKMKRDLQKSFQIFESPMNEKNIRDFSQNASLHSPATLAQFFGKTEDSINFSEVQEHKPFTTFSVGKLKLDKKIDNFPEMSASENGNGVLILNENIKTKLKSDEGNLAEESESLCEINSQLSSISINDVTNETIDAMFALDHEHDDNLVGENDNNEHDDSYGISPDTEGIKKEHDKLENEGNNMESTLNEFQEVMIEMSDSFDFKGATTTLPQGEPLKIQPPIRKQSEDTRINPLFQLKKCLESNDQEALI